MKRTSDSAYENKVWSTHRNRKVLYYGEGLSRCVSRCITLSCCDEGVGFFEPRVPCKLIGAHLLGVRTQKRKSKRLFLVARSNLDGLGEQDFGLYARGMPLISLPGASWTGALQSFIQVGYHSISKRDEFIPPAREFSTSTSFALMLWPPSHHHRHLEK